jgi:hypothetical protein
VEDLEMRRMRERVDGVLQQWLRTWMQQRRRGRRRKIGRRIGG